VYYRSQLGEFVGWKVALRRRCAERGGRPDSNATAPGKPFEEDVPREGGGGEKCSYCRGCDATESGRRGSMAMLVGRKSWVTHRAGHVMEKVAVFL
jgi:hypothetical protein